MSDNRKWRPKTEILISLKLWKEQLKFQIPTTNLGYETMYKYNIMLASEYNSDRQLEISIWPPKLEVITSLELWQIHVASKVQRQIRDTRWSRARQKISQMIATTTDCQKLQDWRAKRSYYNFRLSVVVAIAQGQFLRAGRGRKPIICRWICHPVCYSSRYTPCNFNKLKYIFIIFGTNLPGTPLY